MANDQPLLYTGLAQWFHLLTAPEDYRDEATLYTDILINTARIPLQNVLEMGSGGGNNASHMKARFILTLTDIAEPMLDISRQLNPECEHVRGDMRTMRLNRLFDAVFIHDAISYMTSADDLGATIETAFIHCKPGGSVLFAPDCTVESFEPRTRHGGHDLGEKGMRYLEWTFDPDPKDTRYTVEFAYVMREGERTWSEHETHTLGLFSEKQWLKIMVSAGFEESLAVRYPEELEYYPGSPVFTGVKPGN